MDVHELLSERVVSAVHVVQGAIEHDRGHRVAAQMVVYVDLPVYDIRDERGELLHMLREGRSELFHSEDVAQEIYGEHFHYFDISLALRPQELVGNFCHAVRPEKPIRNEDECLRVDELLVVSEEQRFVENALPLICFIFTDPPQFGLEVGSDANLLGLQWHRLFHSVSFSGVLLLPAPVQCLLGSLRLGARLQSVAALSDRNSFLRGLFPDRLLI